MRVVNRGECNRREWLIAWCSDGHISLIGARSGLYNINIQPL